MHDRFCAVSTVLAILAYISCPSSTGTYVYILCYQLHCIQPRVCYHHPSGEFHSDEAFGGGGLVIVCYGFGVVEYLKYRV